MAPSAREERKNERTNEKKKRFFPSFGARCQFYQLNLLTLSNEHDFLLTKMHDSDNGGSLPTFCCWQNLFLNRETKKLKKKTKEIVCVLYYDEDKTSLRFFLLVRCVNVYNTHSALTQYTIAI